MKDEIMAERDRDANLNKAMEENERIVEEKEEERSSVSIEQQVWSWGAGTDGQLGTEKLRDELKPQLLNSLSSFGPISHLSCGGAHVIALTPSGTVLTWGRGTSGQLGHGEMVNQLKPKQVEALKGLVIAHISAGWNHSGFVSGSGCLFTCGDGSFGQLGHGDYVSQSSPKNVSHLNTRHVNQIACGMRHSLALVKVKDDLGDEVLGFGSGKRGQLGICSNKVRSVCLPQIVLGLEDVKIAGVFANGDQSAAILDDGKLYTWGRGFTGFSDTHIPRHTTECFSFNQAALGWHHALLLTGDGEVVMLGSYGKGVLCGSEMTKATMDSCETSKGDTEMRILQLSRIKVVQLAAGAEHSTLVTDDGSVLAWGWGEHGQLGLGDTKDQASPKVVSFGEEFRYQHTICRVYCGSGFTYVVRNPTTDFYS